MRELTRRAAGLGMALCLTLTLAPGALAAGEERPERGVLTYSEPIAPRYEDAKPFTEGLAAIKENGKWGYIDTQGNTVIPCQYDLAFPFSEGLAIVGVKGAGDLYESYTLGFLDRTGAYTPFQMADGAQLFQEEDSRFHNGYVLLDVGDGTPALYGTDGKPLSGALVPTCPLNEGLIPGYTAEGYVGFMDAQGQVVKLWDTFQFFGPQTTNEAGALIQDYSYISNAISFNQGLAPVWQATMDAETQQESYRLGFMDTRFTWVIQPQFTNYYYAGVHAAYQLFGESGLAMVQKDGKFGAVNKAGETVIPFQYEELWPENEGLIPFKQGGLYGYLDPTGQVAIPAQFQLATGFHMGMAVVSDGARAYLIDRSGQEIPGAGALDPSAYFVVGTDGTQITYQPEEYVVIQSEGKYGYGQITYLPSLPTLSDMDGWAYEEVTAAIEENLVPASLQNLYRNNMTRAVFCHLTVQALKEILGKDVEELVLEQTGQDLYSWIGQYPFKDTTDPDAIAAYALGIVTGRGNGVFDPYAAITRQEAAAFLTRSARVLGMDTSSAASTSFADSGDVGVWFTDGVNFVCQIHVMGDTGGNYFSPLAPYTREQSYVAIYRLFQAVNKA